MKSLIKKIQNFSGRYRLLEESSKIIIGVSGGPDSVCLLDVLVKLAPKYNFKLRIAHVNYGLRGKDSDRDEDFVRKLAGRYGLEVEVMNAGTPPLNPPLGEGGKLWNENALREIRYNFFEKIRKRKKYNLIAVAHNRDDQAETVLMRILRGAGLQGLTAMRSKSTSPQSLPRRQAGPPRRGGEESFVIRLLLNASRKEILEYLKENKLKYQTDISNKDTKIFRNKIRHQLIPYLEKKYNPNIKKTLSDMALVIANDYDYLLANTEKILKKLKANADRKDKIIFSAKKFQKIHLAMQRQVLRQMIFQIKAGLTDIEAGHIEEIIKIIESKKSKIQTVKFKGLKITRIGDRVCIMKLPHKSTNLFTNLQIFAK